ncbi:MAG: holin family protein [Rhodobacterales bacterium]|nr:holin family protein [Rhodobacterales bacterium]MDX5498424.1 holin family protein [Rhodobacterales bacterium]
MGLIGRIVGSPQAVATLGQAAREVAEVFTPNATRAMELVHETGQATLAQYGAEFSHAPGGWFDRFVNGLNRLPRPMLALGTLGLFVYAMAEPEGFGLRMQGLALVPEPLWWLLGAIVAFYFGARETHYRRARGGVPAVAGDGGSGAGTSAAAGAEAVAAEGRNPALSEWAYQPGDR